MDNRERLLAQALWRVYNRPERPIPWARNRGNLPWDDPAFSERMLREHLDESHGAASRNSRERASQIEWFWQYLSLNEKQRILDVTCGPGLYATTLAERGCQVTGVDFSPASIRYARQLARSMELEERCNFVEADVRQLRELHQRRPDLPGEYEAVLLLYGQLAVFPRDEAQQILLTIGELLKPGGKLCIVLLDPEYVDREEDTWWYTNDSGLWGDAPYLHLGERFWDERQKVSIERFQIIHLESGEMDEVHLCDQVYTTVEMTEILTGVGFSQVQIYPAWAGLSLHDASEWVVYVAQK